MAFDILNVHSGKVAKVACSFSRIHEMIKWTANNLHPSLWHEAACERRHIQSPPVPGAKLEMILPWDPAVCLIHLKFFI